MLKGECTTQGYASEPKMLHWIHLLQHVSVRLAGGGALFSRTFSVALVEIHQEPGDIFFSEITHVFC